MKNRMSNMAVWAFGGLALAGSPVYAQTSSQPETYRLLQVAGAELPAVIEEQFDCREEVVEGTLTLEPDGRWTLDTHQREVCGDREDEDQEREGGRYEVEGDTVRFLDDDGDDDRDVERELDDLGVGTRSGDTLTVRLDGGDVELVFRR